jgi:hypothetical protein
MRLILGVAFALMLAGSAFAEPNSANFKVQDGKIILAQSNNACASCTFSHTACRARCGSDRACLGACDANFRLCIQKYCH